MFFESIRSERGCMSYVIGCEKTRAAVLVDPDLGELDRYLTLAASHALRSHYLLDTHTHADHFSALPLLAKRLGLPIVMHREAPAPLVNLRVEDGEELIVGALRVAIHHTPGHTRDSICAAVGGLLLTGALRHHDSRRARGRRLPGGAHPRRDPPAAPPDRATRRCGAARPWREAGRPVEAGAPQPG